MQLYCKQHSEQSNRIREGNNLSVSMVVEKSVMKGHFKTILGGVCFCLL